MKRIAEMTAQEYIEMLKNENYYAIDLQEAKGPLDTINLGRIAEALESIAAALDRAYPDKPIRTEEEIKADLLREMGIPDFIDYRELMKK